jgi:predicted metal-dependent hydrolase
MPIAYPDLRAKVNAKEQDPALPVCGAAGYPYGVSKKSAKIAALIESCRGQELDAHYLGYFECFNRALFYESHDVLEELWLQDRHGPDGNFYKGLIQFAGAFVHLRQHTEQRPRLRPAAALFKLARANLCPYPATHRQLEVRGILAIIEDWLTRLETSNFSVNPLADGNAPRLELVASD